MDISYWTQKNPNIVVGHTTKKYFGKYLYRLAIYCPAGRLIYSVGDLTKQLTIRTCNIGRAQPGWWGGRNDQFDLKSTNLELLTEIRSMKYNPIFSNIHVRVEEPRIQLYAATENILKDLITQTNIGLFSEHFYNINGPKDAIETQILDGDCIIRKRDIGYKYKVIFRDGSYEKEVKNNVIQYLNNIDPNIVKIPEGCKSMFSKSYSLIWGCYFYTNDLSVNTFLTLIAPGIISKSHELVIISDK